MEPKDTAQFFNLAKTHCCNYSEHGPYGIKNYCCMEPGYTFKCLLLAGNPCTHFVEAVLPLDSDLQIRWEKIFTADNDAASQNNFRLCDCGSYFKPRSSRHQYCHECAEKHRKKAARDRKRKARSKAG